MAPAQWNKLMGQMSCYSLMSGSPTMCRGVHRTAHAPTGRTLESLVVQLEWDIEAYGYHQQIGVRVPRHFRMPKNSTERPRERRRSPSGENKHELRSHSVDMDIQCAAYLKGVKLKQKRLPTESTDCFTDFHRAPVQVLHLRRTVVVQLPKTTMEALLGVCRVVGGAAAKSTLVQESLRTVPADTVAARSDFAVNRDHVAIACARVLQ